MKGDEKESTPCPIHYAAFLDKWKYVFFFFIFSFYIIPFCTPVIIIFKKEKSSPYLVNLMTKLLSKSLRVWINNTFLGGGDGNMF